MQGNQGGECYNWPMRFSSFLFQCSPRLTHLEQLQQWASEQSEWQSLSFTENVPDFHLINSQEDNLSIEMVRDLIGQLSFKPYQSEKSIFVIFNIDQASLAAQNALLKSLEEPPAHALILLTTCEPHRVLPTIRSRCIDVVLVKSNEDELSTDETTEMSGVWKRVEHSNYHELFELSDTYKERDQALKVVRALIQYLHGENEKEPSLPLTQALQKLLTTKDLLEKNVNVRLALEDFFFSVKKPA